MPNKPPPPAKPGPGSFGSSPLQGSSGSTTPSGSFGLFGLIGPSGGQTPGPGSSFGSFGPVSGPPVPYTINNNPYNTGPTSTQINLFAPTPPSEVKGTVAGAYSPIPIVYGEARVVGKLFRWITDTWFVGIYVFCRGEIDSFQKLAIDGREIDVSAKGSTEFTDSTLTGANGYCQLFTGTSSQDLTVDATASGRVDNWTTDTYANYACVVIQLSADDFDLRSIPRVEAVVRGVKTVYDPRNSPDAYTANAPLCFAHFLTTYFDSNTTVDDTTLTAVANRADGVGSGNTLSDGSKRHTWGMVVGERPQKMQDLTAFLETAAKVFAWEEAGVWYFNADGPTSSAHTIDGSQIIKGTATVRGVSANDQPADVRVRYYNTTDNTTGLAEALGNVSGTVSEISAPWITTHAEAKRFAVERYNRLANENLLIEFQIPSVGLKMRRGEVMTVTDTTLGLSSKDFRITQIETPSPGIWRVYGREYLASTYSDSIATDPVTGTGKPDASAVNPPAITVAGTATAVGRLARIDFTFEDATNSPQTALAYPFFDQIVVDVYDGTNSPTQLLDSVPIKSQAGGSVSGLPAGIDFYVEARVISRAGVNGPTATATVLKPVLPTPDPPTNAYIDVIEPSLIGHSDAIRCRVTWTDPDFKAWIGFKLKIWNSTTSIGTRDPDFEFEFPQGGVGTVDLEAPPNETDSFASLPSVRTLVAQLFAFNANGVESTGVTLQHRDYGSLGAATNYGTFLQSDVMTYASPPTAAGSWYDDGDDGNGNHTVRFAFDAFPDSSALVIGCYVNVYACNASGVISDIVKRVFFSAGKLWAANHAFYSAGDGARPYGIAVFEPSVASGSVVPHDADSPLYTTVYGAGSSYYRYRVQWVGPGNQSTQEIDLLEDNDGSGAPSVTASPDPIVHGPV